MGEKMKRKLPPLKKYNVNIKLGKFTKLKCDGNLHFWLEVIRFEFVNARIRNEQAYLIVPKNGTTICSNLNCSTILIFQANKSDTVKQ